jgi:hypothetical protein
VLVAVERPAEERPDRRGRGALVRPGSASAPRRGTRPSACRVGWRALLASPVVAAGGALLVAGNVARGTASSSPHEWAGALSGAALLGVYLPLLALLLWAAAGRGRRRRDRVRAAGSSSWGTVLGALAALAVGLLSVVGAGAVFAGLSGLSRSAWRVAGGLAHWRPPDASLLGLLGDFTALGVLGAAALVLLWTRCLPGGAGAARAARGPATPAAGAARRAPAAPPSGPPAPFAKGVVRPGQAPQLPAPWEAPHPGRPPASAPEGYVTLTEAATTFGVGRRRLQTAVRRGALPALRAGRGRTSPWVLRARDVAGYLAPRAGGAEHRPGGSEGAASAGGAGPAGGGRPVRVSDGRGRWSARAGRAAAR